MFCIFEFKPVKIKQKLIPSKINLKFEFHTFTAFILKNEYVLFDQ